MSEQQILHKKIKSASHHMAAFVIREGHHFARKFSKICCAGIGEKNLNECHG